MGDPGVFLFISLGLHRLERHQFCRSSCSNVVVGIGGLHSKSECQHNVYGSVMEGHMLL